MTPVRNRRTFLRHIASFLVAIVVATVPGAILAGGTQSVSPRCKKIAATCRRECDDKIGGSNPFPFWKCVNDCLQRNGCPPGMY